jgi:hypothetical protein
MQFQKEKAMPSCGTREYGDISKQRIDMMLSEAVSQGAVITGSNPWDIDTRLHGTVLRVRWDETKMTMAISVVRANWYIQCEMVWSNIDTLLYGFIRQEKDVKRAIDFG